MVKKQAAEVVQHFRSVLLRDGAGMTDGQLLEQFITHRQSQALEALLLRHGPMIWGVCRRILGSHHDAEDAFQATLLVFMRKANTIAPREMVGNWLYGVAYHTALKGKAMAARRRGREGELTQEVADPQSTESSIHDVEAVDRELSRLADPYRAVVVLCELEGKTIKEAAQELAIPEGTVASRLARGRNKLAQRLAKCGMGSGGLATILAADASAAAVPLTLLDASVRAAARCSPGQPVAAAFSPAVFALAEAVLKSMLFAKLRASALVLLAVLVTTAGLGLLWAGQRGAGDNRPDADLAAHNADLRKQGRPADAPNQPPAAKYLDFDLGGGVTLKVVRIEPGRFTMGSPTMDNRRQPHETPAHQVEMAAPFSMGVFEVTQEQYQRVMNSNPSEFKGKDLPVECVSWDDAMEFCRRLSLEQDKTFDLPTEAEWEYACRAGSQEAFHTGRALSPQQACFTGGASIPERPVAVGSYSANSFGLFDMHGNVAEWCKDRYGKDAYEHSATVDPQGPAEGATRVIRGGSWRGGDFNCRSAYRTHNAPGVYSSSCGFRVVLRSP